MPLVTLGRRLFAICAAMLASGLHASPDGERLLAADLPRYAPEQLLKGRLHSVGADSMDVMTFGWIRMLRRAHPNLEITMEARSSLTAAPALTNGLADVAPIAREFLPSELAMFRQKFGYDPLLIRVASGSYATNNRSHALAVYVHRENPLRELTLAQLDAIFSSSRKRGHPTEIKVWGDIGLTGDWAYRPISIYSMRRPNGIVNFFQQRVLLEGDFKATLAERSNSSDQGALVAVTEAVAADIGGIGFAGFAHANDRVRALALAQSEGSPYVLGTPDSVSDQTYPLARWVYIAVNKPPSQPLPPQVREFLRLVLSYEGQRIVAQDDAFLPLPAVIVREELAKLE